MSAKPRDLTRCSLDEFAEEVCRTIEAFNAVQERESQAAGAARQRLQNQEEALRQRRDLIEAAAAQMQAETASGALFQLALLHGELDLLVEGPPPNPALAEAEFRRAIGYAFSLRHFLEGLAGRPMRDTLSEFYMLAEHDPHVLVDQALAEAA